MIANRERAVIEMLEPYAMAAEGLWGFPAEAVIAHACAATRWLVNIPDRPNGKSTKALFGDHFRHHEGNTVNMDIPVVYGRSLYGEKYYHTYADSVREYVLRVFVDYPWAWDELMLNGTEEYFISLPRYVFDTDEIRASILEVLGKVREVRGYGRTGEHYSE